MAHEKIEPTYLGDAVYASFDGYHITLHLNHHEAPVAVALDPYVLENLDIYRERIIEAKKATNGT